VGKKKRQQAFRDWERALEQPPESDSATATADPVTAPAARSTTNADQQTAATPAWLSDPKHQPEPTQTLPYDVHLLERARTQWQFGQWHALAAIDAEAITHHPERAKLALLAATAQAQRGHRSASRLLARQAIDWGVDRELAARILLSGMHNSLARAAALAGQDKRVRRHFEDALNVGLPGAGAPMAVRARAEGELTQIGLDQALPQLLPTAPAPAAPSYLKRTTEQSEDDLVVFLPDRRQRLIRLFADNPNYLRPQGSRLQFDVPEGMSLLLSSNPDGQIVQPPLRDQFGLAAATDYRVTGHLSCGGCSATTQLIEYDPQEQISSHTDRAVGNRFELHIRTSRQHARLCIAFRLSGCGELDLGASVLRIQPAAPAADG
jgi:hypothetical protein